MKIKKGFAFIETIITIVVLSTSLLILYSTYSAILSDEKTRIYYDDPAFVYNANYIKEYLEEVIDIDKIKNNYFNNTYIVNISPSNDDIFYNVSKDKGNFEIIINIFKINQIFLVKSDMFNKCLEENNIYCNNSIKDLNKGIKKYINSISDISYDYYLIIEYGIKYDSSNEEKYIKCEPSYTKNCTSYFVSVGLSKSGIINTTDENISFKQYTLSEYVKAKYNGVQGSNGIYYHDGTLSYGLSDKSYRYTGKNPNNYVCMSNEIPCSDANLFRIIGVFGEQTKLIRAKSIGNSLWNWRPSYNNNYWSDSRLNWSLNKYYLSTISNFSNKIVNATWYSDLIYISKLRPSSSYSTERNYRAATNRAKIGLMNPSDYGFAASPIAWNYPFVTTSKKGTDYRSAISINWLYTGLNEWLINPVIGSEDNAYYISKNGSLGFGDIYNFTLTVRPCFYLNSSVKYTSGMGTIDNPIRVN